MTQLPIAPFALPTIGYHTPLQIQGDLDGSGRTSFIAARAIGCGLAEERACPGNSDWTNWQTVIVNANLNAGNNTIRATGTTANGGPNLDNIVVG